VTEVPRAIWGIRAERLLEKALYVLRSDEDPLPLMSAAETSYRILLGELPESEMDGYPFPSEPVAVECICPPDLLARGGFRGDCLVHSSLAIIPEEEA
jgi:hypothetical protein